MPDVIEHIEVVKGTVPKRDAKTNKFIGDPATLMFIVTTEATDGHEWYREYDRTIFEALIDAMFHERPVTFTEENIYQERARVDRTRIGRSRNAVHKRFTTVTVG